MYSVKFKDACLHRRFMLFYFILFVWSLSFQTLPKMIKSEIIVCHSQDMRVKPCKQILLTSGLCMVSSVFSVLFLLVQLGIY